MVQKLTAACLMSRFRQCHSHCTHMIGEQSTGIDCVDFRPPKLDALLSGQRWSGAVRVCVASLSGPVTLPCTACLCSLLRISARLPFFLRLPSAAPVRSSGLHHRYQIPSPSQLSHVSVRLCHLPGHLLSTLIFLRSIPSPLLFLALFVSYSLFRVHIASRASSNLSIPPLFAHHRQPPTPKNSSSWVSRKYSLVCRLLPLRIRIAYIIRPSCLPPCAMVVVCLSRMLFPRNKSCSRGFASCGTIQCTCQPAPTTHIPLDRIPSTFQPWCLANHNILEYGVR
jgi:hypothetical protein